MKTYFITCAVAWLLIAQTVLAASRREAYQDFDRGSFDEAQKKFESIYHEHPDSGDDLYNLGVAQYKGGRYKEAQQSFQGAVQRLQGKDRVRALYNRGLSEIKLNELTQAQKSLQEALSYDLENQQVKDNLSWIDEQLKKQNQDQKKDQEQKDQNKDQEQKDQNKGQQNPSQNKEKSGQDKQNQNQQQKQSGEQGQKDKEKNSNQNETQKNAEQPGSSPKTSDSQQTDRQKQQSSEGKDNATKNPTTQRAESGADKNQTKEDTQQSMATGADGQKIQAKKGSLSPEAAQKILRSVDDRVGRIMVPPDGEARPQQKNQNDW